MSDASSASPPAVVDVVDDGMTDEEIVAHTDRRRTELDEGPAVTMTANAAELLAAIRADEAR